MAYMRKFEDSNLDKEPEEFDGKNLKDSEKIVILIQKTNRTESDVQMIQKLTDRITFGAQISGPMGQEALEGLQLVAEAYAAEGMETESTETWARIMELSDTLGNKDLYYYAMDKMSGVS